MFLSRVPDRCTNTPLCSSIKGQHERSLHPDFYCKSPQRCPRADCTNTTVFKPSSFTQHMRSEHGEPKNIERTEHEACRTKEPRNLYNAYAHHLHMNHLKAKSDEKAKGKQPCVHDDCRGATKRYTQENLVHHQKLYHTKPRTLYCTQHDRCESKSNRRSYNTYGLSQNLKNVERDRKGALLVLRCSHPDCSENEDLYTKRQMKHHCKSEHGQSKNLRCSQHLSCKYKTTQYNKYTFSLPVGFMGNYNRRTSASFARRCTHPECVRSKRKPLYERME